MPKWKRPLLLLLAAVLVLGIVYIAFSFYFLDFLVEYWWFGSLGYTGYYLLRLFYRYLIFAGVTLFFWLIFFTNFWVASRYLGATRRTRSEKTGRIPELMEMFRTGSLTVYTPLALILAVFVSYPLFEKWESFLFYIFAPNYGLGDPVYGKDVSFYMFSYPIYLLLQQRLLIAVLILLAASGLLYFVERRMLGAGNRGLPKGAKIHLNVLAVLSIGLFGWKYLLEIYGLLYNTDHLPLFFGPGYTQMTITFPLIWASLICWLVASLGVMFYLNFRKGLVPVIVLCVLFAGAVGLRYTDFIHTMVQKYLVIPNELSKEAPYIRHSVEATLAAYNLSAVETRDFDIEGLPWEQTRAAIKMNIKNIPVWDRELLDAVYDQLQAIRPYYDFSGVDVDRYVVGGSYQQVNLAARELNLTKVPSYAHNWINRHLQYTHGYGLVMTPAAQQGEEPMTWFIKGIPPTSQFDFQIGQPGIYFGQEDYNYAIAPNEDGEMDYPLGDTFFVSNYKGKTGIPITSLLRKLLFAIYFKDRNVFFTTKTTEESKILLHRNFREAISRLTPFFTLDEDPYVVATTAGLYWIQDAYTTSTWFPHSAPYEDGRNYIRNSIKIVVSAYDGTVDYYLVDEQDPIARAFSRIYPGLIKPLARMPAEIKAHIRYPKDIFKIQMQIYRKYHQTDPGIFFQEEDIWEFAERPETRSRQEGQAARPMEPYYVTLNLIDPNQREFLLLSPMSPRNRPNLRALAIAGCDGEHYGKIYVYSFPKGDLVYGPIQIAALIDQNTTIAEQFTLWDQVGSEVQRGRMIILPIGNVVFYIQPVYLSAARELKIPQLQRLIVSEGSMVVMDETLEKAFAKVEQGIKARLERQLSPVPLPKPGEKAPPVEKKILPPGSKAPSREPQVTNGTQPNGKPLTQ